MFLHALLLRIINLIFELTRSLFLCLRITSEFVILKLFLLFIVHPNWRMGWKVLFELFVLLF